ncbi:MAG: DNA-processing protein DprA [Bacteroidales bacterium]|nr:DNA-processing protein DprA [Bacteroidales bacterium]
MYTELFYRIALNKTEGIGKAFAKQILIASGSAQNVFEFPESWKRKLRNRKHAELSITLTDKVKYLVERELQLMEHHHVSLCHYLDPSYPKRLKRCNDAPVSFYYKGSGEFNPARILAVVGTRNATSYGIKGLTKILNELKESNISTVSGLAYGIDTVAHEESLNLGMPTLAVLGNGLHTIYPASNKSLSDRILESGGTLVSEFDFDTGPDRMNFPARNRIIAGMADAVLVAESAIKGGSIITAHIANSYNRDIFAIPGSIFDDMHTGCHDLIRRNIAAIATSGKDILEMMNWDMASSPQSVQTQLFPELSEEEAFVYRFVETGKKSIDEISEHCAEFSPSKLAGILLTMELKGVLFALPGKSYSTSI